MHSTITIDENRNASIHVYSGWGSGPHVKLIGSTYPIVPVGTIVDKLSVKVPDGLNAIAFFCRVTEPRRIGSGKTAYLDHTPIESTSILFSWEKDGKFFIKAKEDMAVAELSQFNPFLVSDTDILVVDSDRKSAYTTNTHGNGKDPAWNYKLVSMDTLLMYITKALSLAELDEHATSERLVHDELLELRNLYRILQHSLIKQTMRIDEVTAERDAIFDKQDNLVNTLRAYVSEDLKSGVLSLCTKASVRTKLSNILANVQ